ncbi:MAG: DUF1819 family protein [Gammaproteobacteria bacterium]|nr:DUF1819 family protein [Gammaproteobacteria bacterium]
MSFSAGSLLHYESVHLAALYLDLGNYRSVRKTVVAENLLQTRTQSTCMRICQEVLTRLQALNRDEIEFLVDCSHQEQPHLLWVAICRRYRFIGEFAVEVLREHHLNLKSRLGHEDFDLFFNKKSEWNPELDDLSTNTRNQLRWVLFKMLRELEYLNKQNHIQPPILSRKLLELLYRNNPEDVMCFPVNESDMKSTLR